MKRLLTLVIVAAALWSAYWAWQAYSLKSEIADWFEERRAAGWTAEYEALRVRGFPNRLDVTLDAPQLQDPESGLGWNAPFLKVLGLSYQPGHHIVAFPETQTVTRADGPLRIDSQGLRASVITGDGGRLLRLNAEARTLNLVTPESSLAMADVLAALQSPEGSPETYRLGVEVQSLAGPEGVLTDGRADTLRLQAELLLDEPLSFGTLSRPMPQPRRIDLRTAEYSVDGLELSLAGKVDVDEQGRMDGALTVRAANWRVLLDRARESGLLPEGFATTLEEALSIAAGLGGRPDTLDIPLNLDRGAIRFGMIPLGQAPRLTWE